MILVRFWKKKQGKLKINCYDTKTQYYLITIHTNFKPVIGSFFTMTKPNGCFHRRKYNEFVITLTDADVFGGYIARVEKLRRGEFAIYLMCRSEVSSGTYFLPTEQREIAQYRYLKKKYEETNEGKKIMRDWIADGHC